MINELMQMADFQGDLINLIVNLKPNVIENGELVS